MTSNAIAYSLATVVGIIPSIVAYLQAKYYFAFPRRSPKQLMVIFFALLAIYGVIPLQDEILIAFNLSTQNEFLRRLTLFQYLAAVIVFVWRFAHTQRGLKSADSQLR